MGVAMYEVWYRGEPIAWFINRDDAVDFIGSQARQQLYEIWDI